MDIWKVWRKKIFFFDRINIRTNILDSELKCLGHFAYFLSAVCQNSISHNEEKLFTENVFAVKVVQQFFSDFGEENLACLWTFQILVSSGTFGQNFFMRNLFFRKESPTLRRTLSVAWQQNLGQSCLSYIPLGQWNFTRGNIFWKTFFFAFFRTSGRVPAVILRKLFVKVVKCAL